MSFLSRLFTFFKGDTAGKHTSPEDDIDFNILSHRIRCKINNPEIFRQALSHRSYVRHDVNGNAISNERLEFLGDAVLNLVVGGDLYHSRASAAEGDLTKARANLVNKKALSIYAKQIHLEKFILTSNNVSSLGEKAKDTILADAYEALIAAIYLDSGFDIAKKFIEREIRVALSRKLIQFQDDNYKSQLLEYSQGEGWGIPRYIVIKEEGPDHDRVFTVEVYLGDKPYGVGIGKSKKDAEQIAAEKALQKLNVI